MDCVLSPFRAAPHESISSPTSSLWDTPLLSPGNDNHGFYEHVGYRSHKEFSSVCPGSVNRVSGSGQQNLQEDVPVPLRL